MAASPSLRFLSLTLPLMLAASACQRDPLEYSPDELQALLDDGELDLPDTPITRAQLAADGGVAGAGGSGGRGGSGGTDGMRRMAGWATSRAATPAADGAAAAAAAPAAAAAAASAARRQHGARPAGRQQRARTAGRQMAARTRRDHLPHRRSGTSIRATPPAPNCRTIPSMASPLSVRCTPPACPASRGRGDQLAQQGSGHSLRARPAGLQLRRRGDGGRLAESQRARRGAHDLPQAGWPDQRPGADAGAEALDASSSAGTGHCQRRWQPRPRWACSPTWPATAADGEYLRLYLDGKEGARRGPCPGTRSRPARGRCCSATMACRRRFEGTMDKLWFATQAAPPDTILSLQCVRQPPIPGGHPRRPVTRCRAGNRRQLRPGADKQQPGLLWARRSSRCKTTTSTLGSRCNLSSRRCRYSRADDRPATGDRQLQRGFGTRGPTSISFSGTSANIRGPLPPRGSTTGTDPVHLQRHPRGPVAR